MKNEIKFKNVEISVVGANGEPHLYHKNNNYKNQSKEDVIDVFKLEPFYMATCLDGYELSNIKTFNTYNWSAPFTLCGSMCEDVYDGIAIVNIHLGGDARGNYSEPYICEEPEALLSQSSYLNIELTNGETYFFDCDNGEAYFDFESFDPYWINFDEGLTIEQLNELKEKLI